MRRYLFFMFIVLLASASFAHAVTAKLKIIDKPVSFGFMTSPTLRTIDTIIIHSTYNPTVNPQTIGGAISMWQQYGVAPHYAIDGAGKIYRLVPEADIAAHAGMATLPNGDTDVNDRSIGIELIYDQSVGPDSLQYAAMQSLIKDIKSRYKITYVLGHDNISPGRKDDPWNFDNKKINSIFTPGLKAFPLPAITKSATFHGSSKSLTAAQQDVMKDYTYRAGCPVPLSSLQTVSVSYYDFHGSTRQGTLVVNKSAVKDTIAAFKGLFAQKFPIRQIAPIDIYQGIDPFSVASDNTSAFNCRYILDTTTYSEHANGTAIDINPKENPQSDTAITLDAKTQGVLTTKAVKALKAAGFKWGGDWTSSKDYQHFSINGK